MEVSSVIVALIAYLGFREWLRHQRRALIHRERLAAIEKGIELPALMHEAKRSAWNVQRVLLLAGLVWISLGVGAYVVLTALLLSPENANLQIPHGIQWIGVGPAAIGLSHLIVYALFSRDRRPWDDTRADDRR